ncbi:MAG: DUF885 domain-containing protein [Proteobacteria bacterium]|nr:MAG: DUF885 domain-containing protein [Pseudomonadota bacterium]
MEKAERTQGRGIWGWTWRIGLGTLAMVVIAMLALAVNLIWFKPIFPRAFFDRVFITYALQDPELLTSLSILEQFGLRGHNARLTDASLAHEDRLFEQARRDYATLMSYDDERLSPQDRLSKAILAYWLERELEREPYRFHDYPVNQLYGLQNRIPSFLDSNHAITDRRSAEHYIARLEAVPVKFAQAMEGLLVREERGIIPPTFVIDKVLAEMRAFVAEPARENLLYTSFADKLRESQITADEHDVLLADVAQAIEQAVYPAYRDYIEYFSALRAKSTDDAGVWKLPDGERFYAMELRRQTTTDLTPDEVHRLGLAEVERIQAEMLAILEAEGYDATQGFTTLIEQVADDPRFYYPDTEAGREQILTDYRAIIEEVSAGLDDAFRLRPKAGVEVRRVPQFREQTSAGAYYNPPAMDGSRPGVFYANLYDIRATPKYGMRALAYHEAVPGHHFQIALQQEQRGLPLFRNMPLFTAYIEGWALYAERLAWELGFLEDPYDNLGRLQAELFRAVRLVVDTGIHAKRWTREQAIEYMAANTGMALSDVVAEIERYIVMPGQACAYKVGMMEILRLREEARAALGEDFDLRDFHDVVLTTGSAPLAILRQVVEDWIASKRTAAS